jgi:hypothetical protein
MESDEENYKQCQRDWWVSGCPGGYEGKSGCWDEAGPPNRRPLRYGSGVIVLSQVVIAVMLKRITPGSSEQK